jgi:hypothetical protein
LAGSQIFDYTINSPRLMGALQVAGGISQLSAGAGMATAGISGSSTGFGAPVGIPATCAGAAMAFSGFDSVITGMRQIYTGKFQDSLKVQLLEGAGSPRWAAEMADLCFDASSSIKKGAKLLSSSLTQRMSKAAPITQLAYKQPFAKHNARYNLILRTGFDPGAAYEAHHVFPQVNLKWYAKEKYIFMSLNF